MAEAGTLTASALLAVLPGLSLGFALRRWLGATEEGALRAGLALAAGSGVFGLGYVLALLLGGETGTILLAEAALAAISLLAGRRSSPGPAAPRAPAGRRAAASLALAVSTLAVLFGFCRRAVAFGEWDSWAIWTLHARFLHRGSASGWRDLFTPVLGWSHADYPLAIPASIARIWSLSGSEGAAAPWLVALVATVSVPLIVYGTLRALRGPVLAAIGALSLSAATPVVVTGAWQYADVPLAGCVASTCALVALSSSRDDRARGLLAAAGAAASLAAWTKNEGIPFALAAVAVTFLTGRPRDARSRFRRAGAVLCGAAPGLVALALFKVLLAPEGTTAPGFLDGLAAKWLDPGRHLAIANAAGRELLGGSLPALLGAAAAVLLLGPAARPAREAAVRVLALVALQAMAYYATYVVTTADLEWHLAHSADRLAVHLVPSLLAGLLLLAEEGAAPPESAAREFRLFLRRPPSAGAIAPRSPRPVAAAPAPRSGGA